MNKIINKKRYDTETAECVFEDSYSNPRDFHYWQEVLYRKRTGEFFLYGTGGGRSRYAVRIDGNGWSSGEKIMPLTEDEARKWVEEHGTADEYESIFSAPVEDAALNVNVNENLAARLKAVAAERGTTQREVIESFLKTL